MFHPKLTDILRLAKDLPTVHSEKEFIEKHLDICDECRRNFQSLAAHVKEAEQHIRVRRRFQ